MRRRRGREAAELAWQTACEDARQLALEIVGGRPRRPVNVMSLGIVLEPGEAAYRVVDAWISQFDPAVVIWSRPARSAVVITDRRMIVRNPGGPLASLWQSGVTGLSIDLSHRCVVLDYGDGRPVALTSTSAPALAVAAASDAYGIEGLLHHPDLEPVRST